jgi:hypothetical protein
MTLLKPELFYGNSFQFPLNHNCVMSMALYGITLIRTALCQEPHITLLKPELFYANSVELPSLNQKNAMPVDLYRLTWIKTVLL